MRNFLFTMFLLLPFASMVFGQEQIQWLTWEQALEKNKIEKRKIVVDVYTQWCGPCKMIAPAYEELEKDYPNIKFLKVDTDANDSLTEYLGIEVMPTFLFYNNKK